MSNNATALAFSHFTFEASNHDVVVIDIQGVKDTATNTYRWTDPQIHSRDGIENGNIADGSGFASGNYGQDGMKKFVRTHVCNGICKHMGLPLLCEHEVDAESAWASPKKAEWCKPVSSCHPAKEEDKAPNDGAPTHRRTAADQSGGHAV